VTDSTWPIWFEDLLHDALPKLPPEESVSPDRSLQDLGLDSVSVIVIVGAILDIVGVDLTDDLDDQEVFATAASVWDRVRNLFTPQN
jgi:acyl carrier protein